VHPQDRVGVVERLEKLVQAGRLTEQEAERLRGAADQREFDGAVREIRIRHATERVDEAVEDGRLSRPEADALLERLHSGEDPRFLRGRLRRGRSAAETPRDARTHG
jgi:hypothetical protein